MEVKTMGTLWKEAVIYAFQDFLRRMTAFLPSLLAMLCIVSVGAVLSWLTKVIVAFMLRKIGLDPWCDRHGLSSILRQGGIERPPSQLLGALLSWILFLCFLMIGINALQIPATSRLISDFFQYLPQLFAAVLILVVGWILANFLGQAALVGAVNANLESAPLLGRAVRWGVLILASSMALIHLGIARQVVVAMLSILLGGLVLALALAFGLGGKDLARKFLEARIGRERNRRKERGEGLLHL